MGFRTEVIMSSDSAVTMKKATKEHLGKEIRFQLKGHSLTLEGIIVAIDDAGDIKVKYHWFGFAWESWGVDKWTVIEHSLKG